MKTVKELTVVAVSTLSLALMTCRVNAQTSAPVQARNIVLVHGAWADGSSWSEVIPRLQAAGLHVTAVQNPLTSVEDSVAETRRVLAMQDGPTVLVAHSWGGTVISETGTDPKVSALVYENRDGFTTISEDAFIKYFANGVQHEKAEVLYAVQQPTAAALFGGRTTAAAWQTKPSWYAVSTQDETISPDLERFLANRMKAHTVEVNAGHLSLVSHPREIADLILEAAGRGKQAR